VVICLELGADLHVAQLMPLPITVSCFSKIQIGFTFLVPAHLGSPGKSAVKRVCVSCLPCKPAPKTQEVPHPRSNGYGSRSVCIRLSVSVASRYCIETTGRIQTVSAWRFSFTSLYCTVRRLGSTLLPSIWNLFQTLNFKDFATARRSSQGLSEADVSLIN